MNSVINIFLFLVLKTVQSSVHTPSAAWPEETSAAPRSPPQGQGLLQTIPQMSAKHEHLQSPQQE